MVLEFKAAENVVLTPVITVFGVGGAGGNAVNNMIRANLQGAVFVVANTDAQALGHSECENRIQLGATSTKGLGAGASPEVGKQAAIESENEIRAYLEGSNMVFVTAGMGGGTGTGASPEIARIARELGILTVGVVTKPFLFEGARRMRVAESGIRELQRYVDTLIVVPNQNLFRVASETTTFKDAFNLADEVLHSGVRSVTDLITMPGLINLDFADIKTVMSEMGKAMMGTGEASGEERAIRAAEAAIANPLLDHTSMSGAKGVLINITGGKGITLYEVDSAVNRIREEVDSDANIIFGSTFNSDLSDSIRVSVVATGIDAESSGTAKAQGQHQYNQETGIKDFDSGSKTAVHDHFLQDSFSVEIEEIPLYETHTQSSKDDLTEFDAGHQDFISSLPDKENNDEESFDERYAENQNQTDRQVIPVAPDHGVYKTTQVKQSLLKRMWSSLKAAESNDATDTETVRTGIAVPGLKSGTLKADNRGANLYDGKELAQAVTKSGAEIQDRPAFLRKNR